MSEVFLTGARLGAWRWLHSIDLREDSPTFGVADREYWAWKTKDFANGTWQGGIAGFMELADSLGLPESERRRIAAAVVVGTERIQRGDGSFEEAYPRESSYAVTALVLHSLLCARARRPEDFLGETGRRLTGVIGRAADFLRRTPETHGIIANHRATAAAALHLLGEGQRELAELLAMQSPEGWFPEYEGADPGYQTLLAHYLLEAHRVRPLPLAWREALARGADFCAEFAFPDGTFAGEIGSRGTAIVYPSAGWVPTETSGLRPHAFAGWISGQHVGHPACVGPDRVDGGNFVPVFNAWAFAAACVREYGLPDAVELPATRPFVQYPVAGLVVCRTPEAMLVFSRQTGALRRVRRASAGWVDESVTAFRANGLTTQGCVRKASWDQGGLSVQLGARVRNDSLNAPWKMMVLRGAGWLLGPIPVAHRAWKRLLASVVMGAPALRRECAVTLRADFTRADLPVEWALEPGFEGRPGTSGFDAHMASANTWRGRST